MPNEPTIDPLTGKPKEGGNNNDPPPGNIVQIPEGEWNRVRGQLDAFDKIYTQPPATPTTPPAPVGPSFEDQVKPFDDGIGALDSQIDEAIKDGKPISALQRERDKLSRERIRLEIKHKDIDPAFATGIDTINQLSDTVTRGQMPHIDLVKDDYDSALNSMPADQRMNPKIRQAAYNIAVGQNITKIMEAEKEKILREQNDPPPPAPGTKNSRTDGGDGDEIPKPEKVLSRDTLRALRVKNQTVDQYYSGLGYDGWKDYWEKTGKDYFEG